MSSELRIALVEDDSALAEIVQVWLEHAQHQCQVFSRGQQLIRKLGKGTMDLILLDWQLPDIDGLEVLTNIRQQTDWPIPVIFVTAKNDEDSLEQALNNGADDYIIKPLRQRELLARIDAVSRRSLPHIGEQSTLTFGHYQINFDARKITINDQPVKLTHKEIDLALFFFRRVGQLLSHDYILQSVWGLSPAIDTRTVAAHASRIRQKLKLSPDNGWRLTAVYSYGYRLERTA